MSNQIVAIYLDKKESDILNLNKYDYVIHLISGSVCHSDYFNENLKIPEICELIWLKTEEEFPIYCDGVKYERKKD